MKHTCNSCDSFRSRFEKSFTRILKKLDNKESDNPYFLVLSELPFIFLDGKIIAGFYTNYPDQNNQESPYHLLPQPLNTLHLTERVVTDQHYNEFEDILECKEIFKKSSDIFTKSGSHCISDGSFEDNKKGTLLRKLMGFNKDVNVEETNVSFFKISFLNKPLYIFYGSSKKLYKECIENMASTLEKKIKTIIVTNKNFFTPSCLKIKERKDFEDILSHKSIELYLYDRVYLDNTLEDISKEIRQILAENEEDNNKKKEIKNDPFMANFLRTQRPDVNFLVITVTPEMTERIYKTVEELTEEEIKEDIKKLYIEFKYYFKDKIKRSLDKHAKEHGHLHSHARWEDICFNKETVERSILALSTGNKDENKSEIAKINYDDIKCLDKVLGACIKEPVAKNHCKAEQSVKIWHQCQEENNTKVKDELEKFFLKKPYSFFCLFLTLLYKAAMENTPLAGGMAYRIGKTGIMHCSFKWRNHPYNDHHKDRYPSYFEMIDENILQSEKHQNRIDIPLIMNGKLFGIFNIYLPSNIEKNYGKLINRLINLIERHQQNIPVTYFLDVCANITDILGGVREGKEKEGHNEKNAHKKVTLDCIIRDAEDLIRSSHGLPRTYIITKNTLAKNKLSEIFGCDCIGENKKKICGFCSVNSEMIDSLFETSQSDRFIENVPPFEIKKIFLDKNGESNFSELFRKIGDGNENLFTDKLYLTYKTINLGKKKVVILQVNTKHKKYRSLMEKINATYLTEAIETGLRGYEKKEEVIRQGTRAAVAAIMGRNMSHNIGSHVLSYWVSYLNKANDGQVKSKEDALLFEYLKQRMDFYNGLEKLNHFDSYTLC